MNILKNTFNPEKIKLSNGKEVTPPKSKNLFIVLGVLASVIFAGKITGFDISKIINKGHQFFVLLGEMFPPDFSYAKDVLPSLMETIKMSLLGSFIGATISLPFAILASVNINHNKPLLLTVRFILSIIRTLPTLVIALIATYVFDLGAFAGTVAIGIFTVGIVSKMIYERIETVDMGAFEAMESAGSTKLQCFRYAILPQILPAYLSSALWSFEVNVRYAAILGYVGAGGIGLILNEKIGWREYDKVGMILLMLFVTVVIIEYTSQYIRERLS